LPVQLLQAGLPVNDDGIEAAGEGFYGPAQEVIDRAEAEARLAQWEDAVREDGPTPFKGLLPMLRMWHNEILNYFDHRYTNGFLEGKNNRIKVVKRVAYGYRNRANFRQRILLTNGRRPYAKVA